MKRTGTVITLIVIVLLFTGAMYYLYQKNQESPVTYETETPVKTTIVNKTVATGNIVPRQEIKIKPNISGIIDSIYVEAGDLVKAGELLATLEVVPNVSNLAQSKNQIVSAKIVLNNQEKVYERQKELFDKGVISANEYDDALMNYKQAQQTLEAAQETYQIIKTGSSKGIGSTASTYIRATISGMVLDVPVKIGNQVIQANNFNEGTTIASIANVNDMIFEGKIDESEVGKIHTGLPIKITIGAIPNTTFDANLYYIAPKAYEAEGATATSSSSTGVVQFEIKGKLKNKDSIFIRAGLSANAAIILDEAEDVLAIKEALVQFDNKTKKPFVEVKTGPKEFERRDIELGVSNSIMVEVKSGLSLDDEIKVWNPLVPAT